MIYQIAGIWRNLSWGCAYAGQPSVQIQLPDAREYFARDGDLSTLSFSSLVAVLNPQIKRYRTLQIHAVRFDARGQIETISDPLYQPAVYPLMSYFLNDLENRIVLQADNTTDISLVDPRVNTVLMPITPSRGKPADNYWYNLNYLSEEGEILFHLIDSEDYHWMKDVIRQFNLTNRFTVHVSVVGDRDRLNRWSKQMIEDSLAVHYLPHVPFTPLPVRIDQSYRQPLK